MDDIFHFGNMKRGNGIHVLNWELMERIEGSVSTADQYYVLVDQLFVLSF